MLTVHHLGRSQSERIVWLCEELGIRYELKRYERDPVTRLAPPEYKALHPIGTAPVITEGDLVLGESGAIMEYVIARHGEGRLARRPGEPGYEHYLYWFHYANASFQALLHRTLSVSRVEPPADHRVVLDLKARLDRAQLHAVRPQALPEHPRVPAPHRRARGVPAGDAQGRPGDEAAT